LLAARIRAWAVPESNISSTVACAMVTAGSKQSSGCYQWAIHWMPHFDAVRFVGQFYIALNAGMAETPTPVAFPATAQRALHGATLESKLLEPHEELA
jgi:hypothetical protein